jgi:hypothetical protein
MAAIAFAVGLALGIVATGSTRPHTRPTPPPPADAKISIEPSDGLMMYPPSSLMKPIAYQVGETSCRITGKSGESAKVVLIPFRVNNTPVTLAYEIMPGE